MPDGTATAHLFRPKLVTVLSEGAYDLGGVRKDAVAALTVAIVALPLSMAIAVASGVSPERGLFTAIVGGFLVSALGGSRYQIGGPAGAFIVLVAATAARFGVNGLLLTVMLSGLMLTLVGLSRLGSFKDVLLHPPQHGGIGRQRGFETRPVAGGVGEGGIDSRPKLLRPRGRKRRQKRAHAVGSSCQLFVTVVRHIWRLPGVRMNRAQFGRDSVGGRRRLEMPRRTRGDRG